MRGTVVGVLRGGPSSEHDVSLKSGHTILTNLPESRFTARDIYIDKQGLWHERGVATVPEKVLPSLDVALIGLHGEYGEDGQVQRLLERYGVPYAGSDSFASSVAMHKVMTKEKAREIGFLTPKYHYVEAESDADAAALYVTRNFAQPVIVKPVSLGSSVGITLAGGYAQVHQAISSLLPKGGVLVEEFIRGTNTTVGVVEQLRGEDLYALMPVEFALEGGAAFFDAEAKSSGRTQSIVPGRFNKVVSSELMHHARAIHQALSLRHYSRSDFIVSPRGIYYLETNTLPGLTNLSSLPLALDAVGVKLPDFLAHLVDLSLGHEPARI